MWNYACPRCKVLVSKNSYECPFCGEPYLTPLRVPPHITKELLKGNPCPAKQYVHKYILPRVSEFERNYLKRYFTVLFADGFEFEDDNFNTNWDGKTVGAGGTLVVDTTTTHHGLKSAKATCTNLQTAFCTKTWTPDVVEAYERLYFRIDVKPSNNTIVQFLRTVGDGNTVAYFALFNDGGVDKLRLGYYYPSSTYQDLAWSYNVDTWYCIELNALMGSVAGGYYKSWVNGVQMHNITGKNTSARADIDRIEVGIIYCNSTNTHNIQIDCVSVADVYNGPEVTGGLLAQVI